MTSPTALGPTLVIIPTYNERDNIEPIIARLHRSCPEVRVLVVDDGSPDGTGEVADKLAAADERVHVLHRAGKGGLGAAYLAGFTWAIEHDFDVLVEMDADGSHAPEQLPRLLEAIEHADLVLGSRWIEGGEVRNWPASRQALSRGGNWYARKALGVTPHDLTGGYRAYRANTLIGVGYQTIEAEGYGFQIELAWRVLRAGYTVVEVPITFVDREVGESKMSRAIVVEAMASVTRWGWQRVRHR